MPTQVDYLYRRGAVYWWRRRVPAALGSGLPRCIARSLRTADPRSARVLARAYSAGFDCAMLAIMGGPTPTREDLARVLDDVFRRILVDGERRRTAREEGPPPWTPEPQTDPLYEGLEPEQWASVPYPPQLWVQERRDALMMNRTEDVRPLIGDALQARGLVLPDTTEMWRRLSRLALVVAAQAYGIDARREWGDYSDGWPQSCGIPAAELPGSADTSLARPQPNVGSSDVPRAAGIIPADAEPFGPLISESLGKFRELMKPDWSESYSRQAEGAQRKFVELIDDIHVGLITGNMAETFRDRLRALPKMHGKSIYAGMSLQLAATTAERLRSELKTDAQRISYGGREIERGLAASYAEAMSLKTVQRDMTIFTSWGKWMLENEDRRAFLHKGESPFKGRGYKKSRVKKEARASARARVSFTRDDLNNIFSSELFLSPPSMLQVNEPAEQLQQAKFWSILIGLYTGMRLGEIAMTRPGDLLQESDVLYLNLQAEVNRPYKTQAADRKIPLHPDLIRLGLPDFIHGAARAKAKKLFPAMTYSKSTDQQGANISKWFTRWRRSIGFEGSRTTFHSLRRTFVTGLQKQLEAVMDLSLCRGEACGHERPQAVSF